MKKVFIIAESWDGCFYYRSEVFRRYSNIFKVKSNIDYVKGKVKNPYLCLDEIFASDIIVFLRPTQIQNFPLLENLKTLGKIIVFSSDDSFATIDKKNPAYSLKKNAHINEAFLKYSDYAICTTEFLKDEYKKINPRVVIIPNLIDFQEYSQYKKDNSNNKFRVGLVGSVHTAENVESFIEILKRVYKKYSNLTLVFFGADDFKMINELKSLFPTRAEFVGGVPITEYAKKLASLNLDVALIPRKDNEFNRAKSNCKYLEMSALKIATIAQGFKDGKSPYQETIKNGENGFIAERDEDWEKYIDILHDKKELLKIKEAAFNYVSREFDVRKKINLWDQAIENMKPFERKAIKKEEIDFLKIGLKALSEDKNRDLIIKNYKKEVKFLNGELDRIRSRAYYRLASKLMDVIRGIRGKRES